MTIFHPLAALREMRRVLKPRAALRRTRPVARAEGRALAPADAVVAPYLRRLSPRPAEADDHVSGKSPLHPTAEESAQCRHRGLATNPDFTR